MENRCSVSQHKHESLKFGLQEDIGLTLVFIDGITRCGKSAFSGVIPSLTKMEHIQFSTELELIISGLSLNGIDQQYAKSFLRIYLNERSYNLHLSRNVNFRPADQTGIDNFKEPDTYRQRLNASEGPDVAEMCRASKNYLPFQTHDLLVNLNHVDALGLNYKMLSLWRNPIDNIYSWWTRGWGERYNGDPTGFSLLIEGKEELYPWYAAGFHNELVDLNAMEKCIRIATDLLDRAVVSYKNSDHKTKIHLFSFEGFCQNTDQELGKIRDFLDVETTIHTKRFLESARFPRIINKDDLLAKTDAFKGGVRPFYFEILMDYQERYQKNHYDLF